MRQDHMLRSKAVEVLIGVPTSAIQMLLQIKKKKNPGNKSKEME